MRIRTIHQLARLESEARPYIQKIQAKNTGYERTSQAAAEHAAVLAFIVRYGNPSIKGPLQDACERCEQSDAWKECCKRFPTALGNQCLFWPYYWRNYQLIAEPVRYAVDWFFPGEDEKDKLNRVFKSAPPWFLWFTFADHSARELGLTIPDLSSIARFERSHRPLQMYDWYRVPEGKFERRPWDDGIVRNPAVYAKVVPSEPQEDQSTPRERQRGLRYKTAQPKDRRPTWPRRWPMELLELTSEEELEYLRSGLSPDVLQAILERKYPNGYLVKGARG